jgi:PAS domain S-box-containing protein
MITVKKISWIVLLIFLISIMSLGQTGTIGQEELRFSHISEEDGLPHANVNCIIQDRQGFMWFGSHGLCKYDGRRIKVYKPRINDPGAMLFDVRIILESRDGILWVGTAEAGLARFDSMTEQFTVFQYDQYDLSTLSDTWITALLEDRDGILWVGTSWHGINRFDPKTEQITRYPFIANRQDPSRLYGREVRGICQDEAGRIWVATDRGVSVLDRATNRFTHYVDNQEGIDHSMPRNITSTFWDDTDKRLLFGTNGRGVYELNPIGELFSKVPLDFDSSTESGRFISTIYKDKRNHIWLGTREGLLCLNQDRQAIGRYQHDPSIAHSLASNTIRCLYQDRSGMTWIGTSKGVSHFDPKPQSLTVVKQDQGESLQEDLTNVSAIEEDPSGGLWIGTFNDGLRFWNAKSGQWKSYRHEPPNPNSLAHNRVSDIHISRLDPNILWIGHSRKILSRLDRNTGQITQAGRMINEQNKPSDGRISCLFEDREHTLWLGTWFGLNWLDQDTLQFGHYQPDASDPELKVPVNISAIAEDVSGALWVGTRRGGLYRLDDQETGRFTRYLSDANDPHSLSYDHIRSLFKDSRDMLWVGTRDGVSRYDPERDSFTCFVQSHFPFGEHGWGHLNSIQTILEDDEGHLWLGSQDGLHVLSGLSLTNIRERRIEILSGYRLGAFRPRARLRGSDGVLYFGTTNGLFAIHPERMQQTDPPQVLLTDLKLFNKSVPIAPEQTPLPRHISDCEKITLGHDQRQITIEFAALDYVNPNENQYAYMLKGFVDDWVYLKNQANVTFTNLDPGDYVFQVKAANSHGVWNEAGASLRLIITPFWWETIWFKVIAVVLILGGIFGGLGGRFKLLRARQRWLETKVSERTRELQTTKEALSKARDDLELQVQNKTADLRNEIAEREKTQNILQEKEAMLSGFINGSADAICIRDRDRRLLLWNKAFAQGVKTNCGVDVHVGMRAEDYIPEGIYSQFNKQRKLLFRAFGGNPGRAEFPYPSPDGTVRYFDVQWSPVRLSGKIIAVAEITRDVTEQKASERKFRTVANFTYDWEYWEDPEGNLLFVSPSCERITGYTQDEFLNKPKILIDIVIPEDKNILDNHRHSSYEGKGLREIQFRIRKKDGTIRWIEHVCQPVEDEQGVFLGYRASNRDITKRRFAQQESQQLRSELIHASRVAAMGELTAAIAHELSQPLTAVLTNAQAAQRFLKMENPDLKEVREILTDIIGDDNRAKEIIQKLRALLRKSEHKFEKININEIVQDVLPLLHSDSVIKNVNLKTQFEMDLPYVFGDKIQLQQVLVNIILNGFEAMNNTDSKELCIITKLKDPYTIIVSIKDSGPGFKVKHVEDLFQPFFTTKASGMGMGLSICRSIIDSHGGKLWAKNNPDQGATFNFTIPVFKET